MFVIVWRYSPRSEWMLDHKPHATEQDARAEINKMTRYDVTGRHEYRIAAIGAPDTWHDPFAEQAEQEGKGA